MRSMGKRFFDATVAALALVLVSPFLVAIAVLIKCDSPGPAFFRQERVGRGGSTFRIHKFRTMRTDAEASGAQLTVGDDPRITRLGRTLRRYKLDELPQLIDVVVGHMSLVGPRPEVPRYVALYPRDIRDRVLALRPGITDPAAIEFFDEAAILGKAVDPERTYVEDVLPRKLARYVEYADQASFWGDVVILINTVKRIVGSRHDQPGPG